MLNNIAALLGTGVAASTSSFESIATATASGSSSTITFSSIPSTYKHLQIRGIARDGVGTLLNLTFNSDTGANYAFHYLRGNGTATAASGAASQNNVLYTGYAPLAASTMGVLIIDILDYASTSKYKTVRTMMGYDDNSAGLIYLSSGLWQNTTGVTSITLTNNSANNFANTTTFALYGIKG